MSSLLAPRGRGCPLDSDVKTRITPLDEIKGGAPDKGADCLVVIYTSDASQFGKRHVLAANQLNFGRGSENDVQLENDSVSRRHCRVEQRKGAWYAVDLDSTNGTYVNDELINKEVQLRRGDQIKVGDTILKYLSGSDVEAQYHETIYKMTIIDGLTGANNKRFLLESLERELPRARRHQRPLSLCMIDIDHFKAVNDGFGHLAGDYVLKELATLIRTRLRPDDILARYGGEEFGIALPETSREGAVKIADQLRALVEKHRFQFEGEHIPVTMSVGVAQLDDKWDVLQLIKAADEKLYEAKRSGRNRVCS
ncbi:MAG: GGDEF domain-containing protein [Sandaracinaceae bacterium]|nr:GGDEF domain-containing protein [Sandaracinaceae bacterium]